MFNTRKIESNSESVVNLKRGKSRRLRRTIPQEYQTFERSSGHHVWAWLIIGLVLAAAFIFAVWYLIFRPLPSPRQSAVLTVDAPSQIIAGDTVIYTLEIENRDSVPLTKVAIAAQWPEGFYFETASLAARDSFATTWDLPEIAAGAKSRLEIQGQLVGNKDDLLEAIFRLSYQPQNFSSDFTVEESVATLIVDTKLTLNITSTAKVLVGNDISLDASLKNMTDEKIDNLVVSVTMPPDFELAESEPLLEEGVWKGSLEAGQELAFHLGGLFSVDAHQKQAWVVQVGQVSGDKILPLSRQRQELSIVNPEVKLELLINGRTKDFEADWGDELQYQLTATNNSRDDIEGFTLEVLMDSNILDLSSFSGGGRLQDSKIIWNKDNESRLALLPAGESVTVTWKMRITSEQQPGRSSVDNVAQASIDGLPNWKATSPLFVVALGDGLSFSQGVYYNLANRQVGSGPLPPKVGEETHYIIIWSLDNGAADYASVNLSAALPPNVTFVGEDSVDEGVMEYDADARRLSWQLDNFSSLLLPLQASFEISLKPTKDDVDSTVTLINPVTIVASGESEFQTKSSPLKSSQVRADQAGDNGTVVE